MAPENNSNSSSEPTTQNTAPVEPTVSPDSFNTNSNSVNSQPNVSPTTATRDALNDSLPANNPTISSPTAESAPQPTPSGTTNNTPQFTQPTNVPTQTGDINKPQPLNKAKKHWLKFLIIGLGFVIILVAVAAVSYTVGKNHAKKAASTAATTPNPISLPPEAIVTSECTVGRGKQYIIPKDIPTGPIYDVENSKVIAIEYLLDIKTLLTNSDKFSSTILDLTRKYPVDHLDIVLADQKPGDTNQQIHVIMFIVPRSEVAKITCKDTSTGQNNSNSTTSTTNKSSNTNTN